MAAGKAEKNRKRPSANTHEIGDAVRGEIQRVLEKKKMLTTEREKKICEKYSARDAKGYVHCNECPLTIDKDLVICKSVAHYDKKAKRWELDADLKVD